MRLIDADAAIKDARLNYGDAHDAVLMEHFINLQPTIPSPADAILAEYNAAIADIYHMGGCPNCKKNLGRSERTGLPICADKREYPNGSCFVWRGHTSNVPLTLEELREMDGEPVWISYLNSAKGKYHIVRAFGKNSIVFEEYDKEFGPYKSLFLGNYGKNWLAYRRRPEEGMT